MKRAVVHLNPKCKVVNPTQGEEIAARRLEALKNGKLHYNGNLARWEEPIIEDKGYTSFMRKLKKETKERKLDRKHKYWS